ncbi:GDSL-type esterase/lipase family protein [Butyrivibrio sp. WCE2006]|uniref:GDSL-type esterase/lipase family protein n=1 Tax=Butyrivibrio sp. WCE2006 TaxID=1410611 RepID=UPI0006793768|nr:GDSL-type esterase/lipase family protein [Butyrivibrio sp. WCE2006]
MKTIRGVKTFVVAMACSGLCACGFSGNTDISGDNTGIKISANSEPIYFETPILGKPGLEMNEALEGDEVIEGDEASVEMITSESDKSEPEMAKGSGADEIKSSGTNEDITETEVESEGRETEPEVENAESQAQETEPEVENAESQAQETEPEVENAESEAGEAGTYSKYADSPDSEESENSKESEISEEADSIVETEIAESSEAQETNEVINEQNLASDLPAASGASSGNIDLSCDLQTLENMHYSDEQMQQIIAFYENTVFAGDSVLLGFRNYSGKSTDPMLKQLQFLAAGSLSLHNSFWPVSEKSVHPLYQGAQHPIWESIQMMGAKRAFLFFGINDVSSNMDESVSLYPQLIEKIKELSPDVEINIISATYTLKDKGKGKLNNENLATFNSRVRELASEYGWGYIDMANVLSDGAGNLAEQYCSDGFLHESYKAYDVWKMMLIRFAANRLGLEETQG